MLQQQTKLCSFSLFVFHGSLSPSPFEKRVKERGSLPGSQCVRLQDAESSNSCVSAGSGVFLEPPGTPFTPRTAQHAGELHHGEGRWETSNFRTLGLLNKWNKEVRNIFWAVSDVNKQSRICLIISVSCTGHFSDCV